jgi:hypothetical protein
MATRVKYISERTGFNIYSVDTGKLVASQRFDTVPKNDPLIQPEKDGSYLGVYDDVLKKFIPDYEYDSETGWFWPGKELDWSAYIDNTTGGGKR